MALCPVCNNEVSSDAERCPLCGYHFQQGTQAFQVVSIDDLDASVPSETSGVPTLTVRYSSGRQEGLVYSLEKDELLIGRSPKCDIFLNDMTVSRSHARLQRMGSDWSIKDCQSYNGLWVNNQAVEHVLIKDGDVIQIGCFILKFEK